MKFGESNNLYTFLKNSKFNYQKQAEFEFRYPVLFHDNSFKIEQLSFPIIDTNIGYAYINGYQIPVHSTPKFDNEISFTMYVEENFLLGEYKAIFDTIIDETHDITLSSFNKNIQRRIYGNNALLEAYIFPTIPDNKEKINSGLVLENALFKSISMAGGFSANSIALSKFDIKMTYSRFYIVRKPIQKTKNS